MISQEKAASMNELSWLGGGLSWLIEVCAKAARAAAGAGVIIACLFLGNFIQRALEVPAPGSVLGMTVLLVLLQTKMVPDEWIQLPCSWLLLLLPACFVPIYVVSLSDPAFWRQDCIILFPAAVIGAAITLIAAAGLAWWMRHQ